MESNLVRIKMNMGDMTRYDMVRLAGNNNPSAQMLMEFEISPKQACFSEYRERACSLFTDLHAD